MRQLHLWIRGLAFQDRNYLGDYYKDFCFNFVFYDSALRRINTGACQASLLLFCDQEGHYAKSGAPNWYEHWRSIYTLDYPTVFDSTAPNGFWLPGETTFVVGPAAKDIFPFTSHTGIDCFAEVCAWCWCQKESYWGWWGRNYDPTRDADQDRIPDDVEVSLGYDPTEPNSQDPYYTDHEIYAWDHEAYALHWLGEHDLDDFTYPGKQTIPTW